MDDNWLYGGHNSLIILTPGSIFPSSNSKDAPPPVLTWLTLSWA